MDEINKKLVQKKEAWAEAKRGLTEEGVAPDSRVRNNRLPPGQHTTNGWPVLDLGVHASVSLKDWTLTVGGLVERPPLRRGGEFLRQPRVRRVSDFASVAPWSTVVDQW